MNKITFSALAVLILGAAAGNQATACAVSPQIATNAREAVAGAKPVSPSAPAAERDASSDDGGARNVVGLWDVKFYDGQNHLVDQAYELFHSDGTEMMTDTSAPATDNVCVGVWKQVGGASFKLKHVSFVFDFAGTLQGTATFNTTITVANNSKSFQGTTVIDVFDTNGNLVFHQVGPVKATRITVD
jgi:hypothetical protein